MKLETLAQAIKGRAKLADLVGQFTELVQDGYRLVGRCPFPHGGTPESPVLDETPSFTIYPTGDFYCFGCNKGNSKLPDLWGRRQFGNDLIAFWREIRRQQSGVEETFTASLLSLARHLKLNELIPQGIDDQEHADLYRVQAQRAVQWNHDLQGAPHVQRYLYGRGVTDAVIERYGLGLVSTPQQEPYTGRVSIPIRHAYTGQVMAFGFRSLHPEERRKYLNSAYSPIWQKGDHFYGLYEASSSISQKGFAILTEDYFGPLVLAASGIGNAIGLMGTSIRDRQIALLRRYTDTIYWWMEDAAGIAALESMIRPLLQAGFRFYVIAAECDADEFALKFNKDATEIEHAMKGLTLTATEWLIGYYKLLVEQGKMATDRALESAATVLRACRRPSERALTARLIERHFNINPIFLMEGQTWPTDGSSS